MFTDSARTFLSLVLMAFVAPAFGCRQVDTNDPEDKNSGNLCRDYSSCDDCIAGQVARGFKKGAAETQCGAAVTGCWTTWKKPVVCSSSHVDDPQLEEAKAKAAAEEAETDGETPSSADTGGEPTSGDPAPSSDAPESPTVSE